MQQNTVHRLKLTLREVRPTVWRRIEIASRASLADLHDAIQAVMPWLDMHLHEFAHPEHQQWTEWIGGDWDPDRFSINEANEALRELTVRS